MKRIGVLALAFLAIVAVVAWAAWYTSRPSGSAGDLARSSDPKKRSAAVDRLASSADDPATAMLRDLARDKDEWVAVKAVRTLGRHRTPERRDLLSRMVKDSSLSARARGEAAATLGGFQDADPTVLTSTLATDPNPKARAGAARGLVRLRKPQTLPQLVQALSDPDPRVRAYANAAIHNMIVRRFPFDPKQPPETQRQAIARITAYLKQCGML